MLAARHRQECLCHLSVLFGPLSSSTPRDADQFSLRFDQIDEDGADPEGVGRALAERMKATGASDILERAESMAVAT